MSWRLVIARLRARDEDLLAVVQRQGLEERILAHDPVDKLLLIMVQRAGNGAAGQPGARRAANANTTPVLSLSCSPQNSGFQARRAGRGEIQREAGRPRNAARKSKRWVRG